MKRCLEGWVGVALTLLREKQKEKDKKGKKKKKRILPVNLPSSGCVYMRGMKEIVCVCVQGGREGKGGGGERESKEEKEM
jgi:hypothetical protein